MTDHCLDCGGDLRAADCDTPGCHARMCSECGSAYHDAAVSYDFAGIPPAAGRVIQPAARGARP